MIAGVGSLNRSASPQKQKERGTDSNRTMKPMRAIRCQRCSSQHKACDKGSPCSRCSQAGFPCSYRTPRVKKTCDYCTSQHKRCDKSRPGCLQNQKEEFTASPASSSRSTSPQTHAQTFVVPSSTIIPSQVRRTPEISHCSSSSLNELDTCESSLSSHSTGNMPSLTEWTSVYSFFYDTSTEAQSSLPHFIIDKKRFLNTFFAQPTALWLIMTAFALRHISSDVLALSYFDRAKLEATQETEAPSFKTIQTLFLISNYATGIKDKATSHLFMELTLDLLARLRLSCEQDESVQSDEDTTIEGFRTVSRIFYTVKCTESCNLGIQKARLPRPLLMLPDIGTNYQTVLSYFNSASFLAIISSAKRHHCSEPPALVHDLLFSPAIRSLTTRLNAIQDSLRGSLLFQPLPHNFQTHGTLSHSILSQQIHFMSHLSNRGCMEQSASVELSCASNAAVCVALRPALYLTGFLHQDSPLLHHVPTRKSLQAALEKCLAASSCIADLASFLIAATRLDSSSSTPGAFHVSATLWEILPNFKFALFEAAVTLWFLACRTKAVFFPVTHSKAVFKDKVVASLMDVLLALSILGATPDLSLDLPAFSPLERCVQAMLCEVQGSALSYCPKSALDTDPSCYLGLLGVQLDCDSVEWNSAWETKWADFWKKAGDNSYLIHKD